MQQPSGCCNVYTGKTDRYEGKGMEMFDIRTPEGEPTGEVKERSAVHRDGDWHGTAHIWLVRRKNGKIEVLLQKRSRLKETFPGCYDASCAGHLSAGDSFIQGALRELQEELGLEAKEEDLFLGGIYPCQVDEWFGGIHILDREISAVYLYDKPVKEEELKLQEEEVEGVCWIEFERLKELAAAGTPEYCISMERTLWKMLSGRGTGTGSNPGAFLSSFGKRVCRYRKET